MSKAKLFIENILIYGLGSIISKLVPLLMLPVVTRLMPGTAYFGLSDLANTGVQFGSAAALVGMYDAMYRLFFDKDDPKFKKQVCSTAFCFTVLNSILISVLMVIFKTQIAKLFLRDVQYEYLVYIMAATTLVSATNSIIAAPTRMQNKRKVFLITNTLSPLISYSISIPIILAGHYVIALPLAGLIAGGTMELIFLVLNHSWFKVSEIRKSLLKPLLVIAVPLFPNFLIYWVFNSCDKVMITNLISVDAAGIYSVGSKLGHASQLIYTAFASGWQFFAFATMKEKDQVGTNSKIFEYLGVLSFASTAFVCAISYLFFQIVFPEQYLNGYITSPYLFLAPLLQMLFQVAGNQFLVVKKTWPNMFILLSGAISNIAINFALIPKLGIEGASIATLIGYLISDVICVIVLCKMKLMVISKRFILVTLMMILFFVVWRLAFSTELLIGIGVAVLLTLGYILLYRKELKVVVEKLKGKMNFKKASG